MRTVRQLCLVIVRQDFSVTRNSARTAGVPHEAPALSRWFAAKGVYPGSAWVLKRVGEPSCPATVALQAPAGRPWARRGPLTWAIHERAGSGAARSTKVPAW